MIERLGTMTGDLLARIALRWPAARRVLDAWAERVLRNAVRHREPLSPKAQQWLDRRAGQRPICGDLNCPYPDHWTDGRP